MWDAGRPPAQGDGEVTVSSAAHATEDKVVGRHHGSHMLGMLGMLGMGKHMVSLPSHSRILLGFLNPSDAPRPAVGNPGS